ncbi:MAG: class I SAM-dependent methyltransferase [Thermoplasmatota archaeon]
MPRYAPRPAVSPVVATLVAAGLVRDDDRVLDVGCGTGTDAVALARWGVRRVDGIDVDRAALAVARRRGARGGVGRRIHWHEHDARDLGHAFPSATFDVILDTLCVNNIANHDQDAFAASLARVARRGATLAIAERVTRASFADPEGLPPPAALERFFEFGPSVATALAERPLGRGAPAFARVSVTIGRRNGRAARPSGRERSP